MMKVESLIGRKNWYDLWLRIEKEDNYYNSHRSYPI